MTTPIDEFLAGVRQRLGESGATDQSLADVLDQILARYDGTVGTLHGYDPAADMLIIRAWRGLPEMLLERVSRIPNGKGMGGLSARRREPVQVCNLQTDESGVAKPSARESKVQGSISVPLLTDGELRGVLGVAKAEEYEFPQAEIDELMAIGEVVGGYL